MGHRLINRYTAPPDTRPRPIADAANTVGTWTGAVIPILTALLGYGVISVVTADAILGLLGVLPGVIASVTAILTATGIIRRAEPEVTPLVSPRSISGKRLVPVTEIRQEDTAGPATTASERDARRAGRRTADDAWWDRENPFGIGAATGTGLTPADSDEYENDSVDDDREYTAVKDGTGTELHREYEVFTGPEVQRQIDEAMALVDAAAARELAGAGTPHTDTTPNAPDTDRGSYSPPDTYPSAGSGGSGHHSPSNHDSGSSGGGWSDSGGGSSSSSSDSSGGAW